SPCTTFLPFLAARALHGTHPATLQVRDSMFLCRRRPKLEPQDRRRQRVLGGESLHRITRSSQTVDSYATTCSKCFARWSATMPAHSLLDIGRRNGTRANTLPAPRPGHPGRFVSANVPGCTLRPDEAGQFARSVRVSRYPTSLCVSVVRQLSDSKTTAQ